MLAKLKQLNLDRVLDIEEAVELSASARALTEEFDTLGIPAPEWLGNASQALNEEIERRTRAQKMARLREVEGKIEAFKSPTTKLTEAQKEADKLRRELGIATSGKASG